VNQYIRFKNRIIEPYICKNILCASAKLVQSMSYFIQCIRSTIIKKSAIFAYTCMHCAYEEFRCKSL